MSWFRVDDQANGHPKFLGASFELRGFWLAAGVWCAQYLTDGRVPETALASIAAHGGIDLARARVLADELVQRRLWRRRSDGFVFNDWTEYNPTRETVENQRLSTNRSVRLARAPGLRDDIKRRDDNSCRYCGRRVSWTDRRSDRAGTIDHVDPTLRAPDDNAPDNLVVACRACNQRKANRTPEQAGLTLLPVPSYEPATSALRDLDTRATRRSTARSGRGRVGSGRDGSGAALAQTHTPQPIDDRSITT